MLTVHTKIRFHILVHVLTSYCISMLTTPRLLLVMDQFLNGRCKIQYYGHRERHSRNGAVRIAVTSDRYLLRRLIGGTAPLYRSLLRSSRWQLLNTVISEVALADTLFFVFIRGSMERTKDCPRCNSPNQTIYKAYNYYVYI